MKIKSVVIVSVMTIVALVAVMLMVGMADPAGAGLLRVSSVGPSVVSSAYTQTQTAYSVGTDLGSYGAIEIQTHVTSYTSTGTVTVQPQYSNQASTCSNSSVLWANGTSYTYTSTTAAGVGDIREIPLVARCFRVKITFADVLTYTNNTYTPTIYLRAVNRN